MSILRGEAEFEHAFEPGKPENLKLAMTVDALMRVEAEGGIGLLGELRGGLHSLGVTALLLRHGLIEGCARDISKAQAGEVLLVNPAAFAAVHGALTMAMPAGDEGDGDTTENPPKAAKKKSGTGPKS